MPADSTVNPTVFGPIGVFDSGFGGLSVLNDIRKRLPSYDYIYLGDNARAPYGSRSFEMVYQFTLQAVRELFSRGCPIVILACNTASAKALRSIQQRDLPASDDPTRRVLGVIRPTVESIAGTSKTNHIGILATPGTIASRSYDIEISHLHPHFVTTGHACPLWVHLIENGVADTPGAAYFIKTDIEQLLAADPDIDTVILGCTHYPLIIDKIRQYMPANIQLISQGDIVAESLADYLQRHPEMARRLSYNPSGPGQVEYLTTEKSEKFDSLASLFVGHDVKSRSISL